MPSSPHAERDRARAEQHRTAGVAEAPLRGRAGQAGRKPPGRQGIHGRVGGREHVGGRWHAKGTVSAFDCLYLDIVPNERIIYTYGMHLDDRHISESLATLEFRPEGSGTRFRITEQGAFLDGFDGVESREEGTKILLDRVGQALAKRAS